MKKQLLIIALLSISMMHSNAENNTVNKGFEKADPQKNTDRYHPDFLTYKQNVIQHIRKAFTDHKEKVDVIYVVEDINGHPTNTTLHRLFIDIVHSKDEKTLKEKDIHYQNTLYLIHLND
ncbi:hypothetical protein K9K77_02540 [Candidatus Babeliales bacterium]|nr:hypothetical protein [Candidatus Babeliales bacterium]